MSCRGHVSTALLVATLAAACASGPHHQAALQGRAMKSVERCSNPIPRQDVVVEPPNYNLDGAVAVVHTHTGSSRVLAQTVGAGFTQAFAVSHARCAVAFATIDESFPNEHTSGGIYTVDPAGGHRDRLLVGLSGDVQSTAWSPDDSRVAYEEFSGTTSTLWTIPVAGGEPTRVAAFRHVLRGGQPLRIVWVNPTTLLALVTKFARPYVFSTSIWAYHLDGSRKLLADASRLGVVRIDETTLAVDPSEHHLLIGCYLTKRAAHGSRPALCSVDLQTLRTTPIPHTTAAVEGVWLTDHSGVAYLRAVRENPRNFPIMIDRHGVVTQLDVPAFARGVYDIG
jgi:hypothetical protein